MHFYNTGAVDENTTCTTEESYAPPLSPQALALQQQLDDFTDFQIERLMLKIEENLGDEVAKQMFDHAEIVWQEVLNSPHLYFDETGDVRS